MRHKLHIIFLLFTLASPAFAQQASPIYVSFEFSILRVYKLYLPDKNAKMKEREIATKIAKALSDELKGFWSFQQGDQYPRLRLSLVDESPNAVLHVGLVLGEGQSEAAEWNDFCFNTADYVLQADLPTKIPKSFQSKILKQMKSETLNSEDARGLKLVPLGKTIRSMPLPTSPNEKPLALLPLKWKDYFLLSKSIFVVECKPAAGGAVSIESVGVRKYDTYPAQEPFPGILVRFEKYDGEPISQHGADVNGLRAIQFRLQKFEFSGLSGPDDVTPEVLTAPGDSQ